MFTEEERLAGLFCYEDELKSKGFKLIAGVDEAGRGPLAGPVVAAAVILPERANLPGLNDSKKVSERKREELARQIKKEALSWAVNLSTVNEILFLNIHRASLWAMKRAVKALGVVPHCVLVDGNSVIPGLGIAQFALVGGDRLSASIAAASILAKVTRDHLMQVCHQLYPQYGFDINKGYPTKAHHQALSCYGPSPVHRRGFHPVKELIL